jgi:phosphatidylserine decarboxylase
VSPCDAVIGASGTVVGKALYQIKGFSYSLVDLMGDPDMVDAHRDARPVAQPAPRGPLGLASLKLISTTAISGRKS